MLHNKTTIAVLAITLIAVLIVVGIAIFVEKNGQNRSDTNDTTGSIETTAPDSETVKVEDETKSGISSTPFMDIEEGNEIYFDADVVEKLGVLHDAGEEDLVNDMLDWISGFINYFAAKGYSHKSICQIQRLFLITAEDMMKMHFQIACLNMSRCIPATGADETTFENDVFQAFAWTTPYDYSYVLEVEVAE